MSCFCVGQKGAFTYNSMKIPLSWPRTQNETKGDKQQGIHKWVRLNAPVDATSETLLFWCLSFIEIWFQFIQSPGTKLVISLCQTRISMQRHYSHSTQCPAVPSPASGLLCPPPFSHPWGTNLIIVRIPIRRWRWFNLLRIWFLCPIWYWQPLTTPAALQSFC